MPIYNKIASFMLNIFRMNLCTTFCLATNVIDLETQSQAEAKIVSSHN